MARTIFVLFGVIALGLVVFVGWRFASRRHNLPCPSWLRWFVELDNPFIRNIRANVIVEHLGLQPGMRVLDIGCGPGRLSIPIAQSVGLMGNVVAIDIQTKMLRRAEEKAREANLNNITFHHVKVGDGNFDLGQFDRAVLVSVLGEIPDRQTALQSFFAALKPGGILSVTEVILDPHFQSRDAVLRLACSVGFREKNFFGNRFAFSLHLEKPLG
jgi:cyclopropane fatty-acyl-phospholipid synthase-like methyltransferase